MKTRDYLLLFACIVVGATIANLIALKIAGDAVSDQYGNSSLGKLSKYF